MKTRLQRPDFAGLLRVVALLLLALCAGCGSRPVREDTMAGQRIAQFAIDELGRPYRYGGEESASGFDCSGLARAVHASAGVSLARTAAEQFADGEKIARDALLPGDLVFFRFGGRRVDHVGVYVGGGEFIHAPRAGERVQRVPLAAPWFAQRYAGATRYWRD